MREHILGIIASWAVCQTAVASGGGLSLSLADGTRAEAARQPAEPPLDAQAESPTGGDGIDATPMVEAHPNAFGVAGSSFWTVGGGYMNNFGDDQAGEVHLAYSHFLADDLEFSLELSAWYFDQEGENTGAISPIANVRWHFLHDEAYDWSIFGEAGFGFLFAFDNVPDGGTGFNFLPRFGAGFTKQLNNEGARLMAGVRWQHISNGRIEGDARNPGRDSVMLFAGVMFPF
jgi:hypothetical protein